MKNSEFSRFFITGAAGFIGSNLAGSPLEKRFAVTGYDNFSTGFPENIDRAGQCAGINIIQGDVIGRQVIAVTNDILKKLSPVGKDLTDFSLDTVKMFRDDAVNAGYQL